MSTLALQERAWPDAAVGLAAQDFRAAFELGSGGQHPDLLGADLYQLRLVDLR